MKYCPSFWGYSVTEDGRVFTSRKRFGKGRGKGCGMRIDWNYLKELNPYKGQGGYLYVAIAVGNKVRSIAIHTLLLDAFVGVRPKGLETRHLDGNPLNNNLSNLLYGTRAENTQDKMKHGRHPQGARHGRARFKDDDIKRIRQLYSEGASNAILARQYECPLSTMLNIVSGKLWRHVVT